MSDFTAALHRYGLLGNGQGGGPLGLFGDILHLPIDALRGTIDDIRARPQILRMALEDARNRQAAMQRLQGAYGGIGPQAGPPQAGPAPIDIQGAGQDIGGLPIDQSGGTAPQLPPMASVLPSPQSSAPPRPPTPRDYRPVQEALSLAAASGIHGMGDASTALERASPDMQVDTPSGLSYDRRDPNMPARFARPEVVSRGNGSQQVIDIGDPSNRERFLSGAPAPASREVYDSQGRPLGWVLEPGATAVTSATAAAEQGGRQANTVITATDSQGRPVQGYAGSLLGSPPGAPGTGAVGGGSITGQSPADARYETDTAAHAAEQFQQWQTAGASAPGRIANYQAVGDLLRNFNGNQFSGTAADVARVAETLGIHIAPGLSAQEAAMGLVNNMVLQARNPANGGGLPGNTTPQELRFLEQSLPGLAQSAAGRQQLVQILTAQAQRDADRARAAQQWQDRYSRIDRPDSSGRHFSDYWGLYMQRNPLIPRQRPLRPPGAR